MSIDQNKFRGIWHSQKFFKSNDKDVGYILENEVFINIVRMDYMRGSRAIVLYYWDRL